MINVYGIETPDELVVKYYKTLIGRIYGLLPTFEGIDIKSKEIVFEPEESFQMFKSSLENLILEICGSNDIFLVGEKSIRLLSLIRGLQELSINDHSNLRSVVFLCTDLCSKIANQLIQDWQNRLMNESNVNNKENNNEKDGGVSGCL
jgi:hypothetical protein